MRAGFVIVAEIIFEQPAQMIVIEDDYMIQTLATNAANYPFHVAIFPRTPLLIAYLLDDHSLDSRSERFAVDSVAISNHKPRSVVLRKSFDHLLCGPNRRGMPGDIKVDDAATIVSQDDEYIQDLQT